MSDLVTPIISIAISLFALLISMLSYSRDSPSPIVKDAKLDFIPKHGVFSYRESRADDKESFFFFGPGVLAEFKLINPSSKPISIFELNLCQSETNISFTPLFKETAGNAQNDKIIVALSSEHLSKGLLLTLPLHETLNLTIPAYGVQNTTLFFLKPDDLDEFHPKLQLSWSYAKRRKFWRLRKLFKRSFLKNEQLKLAISPDLVRKPKPLSPEKVLKEKLLHQIASD